MPTINLDLNYFTSITTVRLKAVLGKDSEVLPIKLACYVGKHHGVSGSLAGYSAHEIETLVEWWGKPGEMVDAMVKVGILRGESNNATSNAKPEGKQNYVLANWKKEQGHIAFYAARARNAAKKRWESNNATSNATSNAKEGGVALLRKKGGLKKEKEVCPLVSPLASPLLSPYQEKEKGPPLPPLQGGGIFDNGDLQENQTANDPIPPEKSALLAGGYKKIPTDIAGDEMPIKDVPEDIDITKTPAGVKVAIIAGNPEKVPRNAPGTAPAGQGVSNSVVRLESLISDLQTPKNGQCVEWFEAVWQAYPVQRRIGKKAAFRHFKPSVRTENDFALIKQALSKYLASTTVKNGYLQNGSTWFNNWRDWLDYKEPETNVYDEDLVRDRVTGEVQHDPITGEALRVKRDPVTGKVIGSRWYTRPSIAEAKK